MSAPACPCAGSCASGHTLTAPQVRHLRGGERACLKQRLGRQRTGVNIAVTPPGHCSRAGGDWRPTMLAGHAGSNAARRSLRSALRQLVPSAAAGWMQESGRFRIPARAVSAGRSESRTERQGRRVRAPGRQPCRPTRPYRMRRGCAVQSGLQGRRQCGSQAGQTGSLMPPVGAHLAGPARAPRRRQPGGRTGCAASLRGLDPPPETAMPPSAEARACPRPPRLRSGWKRSRAAAGSLASHAAKARGGAMLRAIIA